MWSLFQTHVDGWKEMVEFSDFTDKKVHDAPKLLQLAVLDDFLDNHGIKHMWSSKGALILFKDLKVYVGTGVPVLGENQFATIDHESKSALVQTTIMAYGYQQLYNKLFSILETRMAAKHYKMED